MTVIRLDAGLYADAVCSAVAYLKFEDEDVHITAIPYPTAFCSKLQVRCHIACEKQIHVSSRANCHSISTCWLWQVATTCWAAPLNEEQSGVDDITFIGSSRLLAVPTGCGIQALGLAFSIGTA